MLFFIKGVLKMKKNWFALISLIFFNLVVVMGFAIALYAIIASFWIIIGAFIISPILLVIANVTQLQDFSMFQSISSIFLCAIGLGLFPFMRKFTRLIITYSVSYIKYNKKMIYSVPL